MTKHLKLILTVSDNVDLNVDISIVKKAGMYFVADNSQKIGAGSTERAAIISYLRDKLEAWED